MYLPKVVDIVEEAHWKQPDSDLSDSSCSEDMHFGDHTESDMDWSQEEIEAVSDDDENNDMEDKNDPRRIIQYVHEIQIEVLKR